MNERTGLLNEAALRSVVAAIELDPTGWRQGAFTTRLPDHPEAHCFAAWTCILAGLKLSQMLAADPSGEGIYLTARDLLGLDTAQAGRLFLWGRHVDPHPSVDALKARITALTRVSFPPPVAWVDDGHGNIWLPCRPGCDIHVVRPGKAQCSCR